MSKIREFKEPEIVRDDEGNPIYYYIDEDRFLDGTPTGKGETLITLPGFDAWFDELKKNIFNNESGAQQQIPEQVIKYVNTSPSYNVPIQSQGLQKKHFIGAAFLIFSSAVLYKILFKKKRGRK